MASCVKVCVGWLSVCMPVAVGRCGCWVVHLACRLVPPAAKGVAAVLGGGCRVCVQQQRKVLLGFEDPLSQAVQGFLLAA